MVIMVYIIAGVFFLGSIFFMLGKGAKLLTSGNDENVQYDEKKVGRLLGVLMLLISVMLLLMAIFNNMTLAIIFGVIIVVAIIVTFILVNLFCKK